MQTNFRNEIVRLKKGIRIAWMINFTILCFVFIAGLSLINLNTYSTNSELLASMMTNVAISVFLAVIVMFFVSKQATAILLSAPAGDAVEQTTGQLYNIVEEISIAASLKHPPRLYLLRGSGVPNAYACADNSGNSQVVVTEELLNILKSREEIEGVIAHEIGHIVQGDSQAMTKLVALTSITALIAGTASRFIYFGGSRNRNSRDNKSNPLAIIIVVVSMIFLTVAPLLAKVAEAYMSRERESRADASAVQFTRNPTGLATALLHLEGGVVNLQKKDQEVFNKTLGPVAFFNPMSLKMDLSTHPSTEKRVHDLIAMGAQIDNDGEENGE
ncbi:MAG: M48 family metalloprotease [Lactovum sp.]